MRANEFIIEAREGTIHPEHQAASQGIVRMRDQGGYDRTYHLNRIWMATAMADGKSSKAVDMDSSSWIEKYNTAHPYTKEEDNMIRGALKTVGANHHAVVSDHNSTEPNDINCASPVKGFKGYAR